MKCEQISNELIAYVDGHASARARHEVKEHLAGCVACRARLAEMRKVWTVLDEAPAIEPSFGFDARLRQRIAAEPRRSRFFSLMPRPRLALSMALLAALTILVVRLPLGNTVGQRATVAAQQEDFNAIKNLGVLEDYDVVTKLSALSDLAPTAVSDSQPQDQRPSSDSGNGGA